MRNNEKARPAGGTAERAAETGTTEQVASLSTSKHIIYFGGGQAGIERGGRRVCGNRFQRAKEDGLP